MSKKNDENAFNSVQLNVVTFIDVARAQYYQSLENAVYMMDNSIGREGPGTPNLETICKQGQVINWIIYPMNREAGIWPKITNIVFLEGHDNLEEDPSEFKVCTEFKVYGGPDYMYSQLTPVYYYWAGMVLGDLPPGKYFYRFVLEVGTDSSTKKPLYLNTVGKPCLKVLKDHN